MVLSANWSKKKSVIGRRMGFLLVFFPEEDHHHDPHCNSSSSLCHTKIENNTLLSLPSSPARASSPSTARKSGSRRGLMCKAQSTLSICSLFVFTTFLLFTLSTFEPTTAIRHHSASTTTTSNSRLPRRILLRSSADPVVSPQPTFPVRLTSQVSGYLFRRRNGVVGVQQLRDWDRAPPALQGMGKLYRRGTRAMSDLIVADVDDEVNETEFRAFLRILHNNGLLSRLDFVFLFSSPSVSSRLSRVIDEENDSLHRVISAARGSNRTVLNLPSGLGRYFAKSGKGKEEVVKESIWGKGGGTRRNNDNVTDADESKRPNYGSVVGFEASELDPENSLSGFLDLVPMGLRKWACYPMLLGRVRRKYKHVGLVDMKEVVILNDPFSRVKNGSPESVLMWTEHNQGKETASKVKNESGYQSSRRHNHRSSKGGHKKGMETDTPVSVTVSTGIVVGGTRGVRRLSDAVLTQIVRAAMEHSSVSSKARKGGRNTAVGVVTQSAIVNKLVHGGKLLLKKVDLVVNDDGPIPVVSELATVSAEIVGQRRTRLAKHTVARWGRNRIEDDNQRMVGFHEISKSVIVRE